MRSCPRCERYYADEVLVCPKDDATTRPSLPGSTFLSNRYRIERLLGRGATGSTFLARDENLLTRRVAVKVFRPELFSDDDQSGSTLERFMRYARAVTSVLHPNVLVITDFGQTPENLFYLIMEYQDGETLHRILRREGTLSYPRTLDLLRQAAAGIEAAQDLGVLHLNLKPGKIFVLTGRARSGSKIRSEFVRVGDFGLAKALSEGRLDYSLIGTPEFIAPEQISSSTELDARTDIHALGAIAYLMLAGRPPFTGDLTQLLAQMITGAPPLLSTLRPDIPPELQRAVMHALEREPDARPSSMTDWIEELDAAASKLEQQAARNDAVSLREGQPREGGLGQDRGSQSQEYDVFISYRRVVSSEAARAIRAELSQRRVRVFLDVDELRSGHFDEALLDCIARTANFVVILSVGCFDRGADQHDWMRQEIAHAIKLNKNIIPVTMPGFSFPATDEMAEDIRALQMHQRVRYDHEYFDAMMERIIRFLHR